MPTSLQEAGGWRGLLWRIGAVGCRCVVCAPECGSGLAPKLGHGAGLLMAALRAGPLPALRLSSPLHRVQGGVHG